MQENRCVVHYHKILSHLAVRNKATSIFKLTSGSL